MEKCFFPLKYMHITQGMNGNYSHKGSFMIDYTSKDYETRKVYAPFTGIIKKKYNDSHSIWFQSLEKVMHADGSIDFATMKLVHDNDISNLKIGKKYNQGEHLYTMGDYGNATGIHVDIEIAKGKFKGSGWYKNKYGVWCLNNSHEQYKSFILKDDTMISKSYNYPWRKESEYKYEPGLYLVTCNVLTVRRGPGITYDFVRYKNLTQNAKYQIKNLTNNKPNGYVKGVKCNIYEINDIWGRTPSGWICLNYTERVL